MEKEDADEAMQEAIDGRTSDAEFTKQRRTQKEKFSKRVLSLSAKNCEVQGRHRKVSFF